MFEHEKSRQIGNTEDTSLYHEIDGFLGEKPIDRSIIGNSAEDMAVQILGPVGEDLWDNIGVQIKNNRATGLSLQVGYPTSVEAFKSLLDYRARLAIRASEWSRGAAQQE